MTTHFLRKKYNLTQLELSTLFGIPLNTIKTWDSKGTLKEWQYRLLDYALESQKSPK